MIRFEYYKSLPSKIISKAIVALGLLTILLCSLFLDPDRVNFLPCFFRQITGHRCPSCGLSHSFHAISHFHIQESFKFHLMGPVLYLILLLLLLKLSVEIIIGKEVQIKVEPKLSRITLAIFLCLWIVFWIIRFLGEF